MQEMSEFEFGNRRPSDREQEAWREIPEPEDHDTQEQDELWEVPEDDEIEDEAGHRNERGPDLDNSQHSEETEEPPIRRGGSKDSYTIGEVVARLRQDFPSLSVSKIRYLERRKLVNLSRTRGGYRLFSARDIDLLRHILTLQERDYLPLKVIKKKLESGEPIPSDSGEDGSEVQRILEERTYTRQEMAEAIESEHHFVDELASVGVIGRHGQFTQRDVEIAKLALEMARYSIQPRHLRGIMAAVDREAAMFKQVFNPELRSGDEQRMQEAVGKARHLASVDSRMKELMMASIIETFAR